MQCGVCPPRRLAYTARILTDLDHPPEVTVLETARRGHGRPDFRRRERGAQRGRGAPYEIPELFCEGFFWARPVGKMVRPERRSQNFGISAKQST